MKFLKSPETVLGPYILLDSLCSNILNLYSPIRMGPSFTLIKHTHLL